MLWCMQSEIYHTKDAFYMILFTKPYNATCVKLPYIVCPLRNLYATFVHNDSHNFQICAISFNMGVTEPRSLQSVLASGSPTP